MFGIRGWRTRSSCTRNIDLRYRIGRVTAHASARWDLSAPPGGRDASRVVAHGTRANVILEQGVDTGHRRRLIVEPWGRTGGVPPAMTDAVAAWRTEFPGLEIAGAGPGRYEVAIPAGLDAGHVSHFTRVLDECLDTIDARRWPAAQAARTLAKYTFLAEVAAKAGGGHTVPAQENR